MQKLLPPSGTLHRIAIPWLTPQRGYAVAAVVSSDAQKKTIYALSTPHGKAGVGVVRVSGPGALNVWKNMVKTSASISAPKPWTLHRCDIIHPSGHQVLDSGLAVFFRGAFFIPEAEYQPPS